jgi:hypothetical protein
MILQRLLSLAAEEFVSFSGDFIDKVAFDRISYWIDEDIP